MKKEGKGRSRIRRGAAATAGTQNLFVATRGRGLDWRLGFVPVDVGVRTRAAKTEEKGCARSGWTEKGSV